MQISKKHVPELDGVRGLAALSILVAHCFLGIMSVPGGVPLRLLLGGVDLFFVLSGFLISGILMDSRGQPHYFKVFWIRRIARIFPVLYVLLASYALGLWARYAFDLSALDLWVLSEPRPPIWTYATFMQSFPIAFDGPTGPRWLGITWSLAIEEQFYLFFPFATYFLSRRAIVRIALIAIAMAPVLRWCADWYFGHWYAGYVLLPSRADGLMFGVLAAAIVRHPAALATAVRFRQLIDLLALLAIYIVITHHWALDLWPSPVGTSSPFPPVKQSLLAFAFAIFILRLFLYREKVGSFSPVRRILRSGVLTKFGLISYGLYMYHQSINGLTHAFIYGTEPYIASWDQAFIAVLVMALAIGVATLSYRYMEKPIRSYGHRLSHRFSDELVRRHPPAHP